MKYMAVFDFDETVLILKNQTLIEVLDGLYKNDEKIAAFMFRSGTALFNVMLPYAI